MPLHLGSSWFQESGLRSSSSAWSRMAWVVPPSSELRLRRMCQRWPNLNLSWFWPQMLAIRVVPLTSVGRVGPRDDSECAFASGIAFLR